MKEVDLVVIGAGPAGTAAAGRVARRGGSVLVVDENFRPGGKVLGNEPANRAEARGGARLRRTLDRASGRLELRLGTVAWAVEPDLTVALGPTSAGSEDRAEYVRGRCLLLAGGARERTWPFAGWTLPGVFTLGAISTLVRRGVYPGRRFLLAGAGPLLAAAAMELTRAGLDIQALVQAPSMAASARRAWSLARGAGWSSLAGLAGLAIRLGLHRSFSSRRALLKVEGSGRVENAVTIQVDENWRPLPHTERTHRVDAVGVGYGLTPNLELARALELDLAPRPFIGEETIRLDAWRRTSRPEVFTAGDGAGIKGWEAAWREGELAAIGICMHLGDRSEKKARQEAAPLWAGLRRFEASGRDWEALSGIRHGLIDLLDDDVTVCRCEEVTAGRIRNAVRDGAGDLNDLKRRTRLGMGPCQGRFCGKAAFGLLKRLLPPGEDPGRFTARPPFRPTPLGVAAQDPS